MATPNVRITLEDGTLDVGVLAPGVRVEVRDYDIRRTRKSKKLWTDERGRKCCRYFVWSEGRLDSTDPVADDLERFADDLGYHAGVPATVTPDSSPDGLHVLTIKNYEFYFEADSGRYDGWGKSLDDRV